ncbi:hypothetical protein R3X27_05325 [Tropicimonas sp. TH_r6]|uniref:hypothetical protein n=1 Tax=Tropicimonas sp. TH_r6 TaxID=3082085 RepID=UPI002954FA6E|nr:hypothetical protein [Tropicimonas sp. TH_r6]MDV7142098.1 hypothetical protein [Tropicimonas sp. TH_r6]
MSRRFPLLQRLMAVLLCMSAEAALGETDDLFSLSGNWVGDGVIAARTEADPEPGRCNLRITPNPAGDRSDVTGKCAIAGGASRVSMRFEQGPDQTIRAGIWSEATEQIVQFRGEIGPDEAFLATDRPISVDDRLFDSEITFSFDLPRSFSLHQTLRAVGEPQWRPVIELTFLRAGD